MSTQTILICLVTYLLFLIARCKSCELAENSVYAAAKHPPVSGSYSTYSCTPCPSAAYEVHVINIYEPSGTNRGFQQTIDYAPVHLQIKSDKAVDVKLVLMSYETADWEITKSSNVNILNVLVASYKDSYSSATLKNSTSTLRVQVEREYFSGWREIDSVKTYVAGKFGHMSTFTGVYTTSSWDLTVGTCDNSITTTSKSNCPDGCWLKYSFTYEDNWNSCHGDQYITIYKQYYVGVVLCSSTRYKLFMSESLSERFLNIADGGGHGQDHCEFIGGSSEDTANLPNDFWDSPSTTGYYRNRWGGTVLKGLIGGSPKWTGKYYVKWYECGVSVPGSKQVVIYDGSVIFTPQTISTTSHYVRSSTTPHFLSSSTTSHYVSSSTTVPYVRSSTTSHYVRSSTTPHFVSSSTTEAGTSTSKNWIKYSFKYEDNWNSCHGDQYVTTYKEYYVGAILCSSNRYKLFMSESLSERFLNIADSIGHGEDHCEFIGGKFEGMANLPDDFWVSPLTTGYYRSHWGGTVLKGPIGGSQTVLTGTHYVKWYECGVSVPGMSSMSTTSYIVEHTSESESSINVIAIIGLAVGVIVGLAVIIGVVAVVILLILKQRSRGQPGQVVSNPAWNGGQGGAMYSSAQPGQVSWQQQHNPAINPPQPMGHNAHSSTQMNGVYTAPVQNQSGPPPNYYEALQVSKPVGNNGEEVSQNYESLHPKANRQSGEEGIYLEITNS